MILLNILNDFDILEWSTIAFGLKKKWINCKEVISFADSVISSGCLDEKMLSISATNFSSYIEAEKLIFKFSGPIDENIELEKWKLAYLTNIEKSELTEQSKIDKLQLAYAILGYPDDMSECSIYSQSSIDPLLEMKRIIDITKNDLIK